MVGNILDVSVAPLDLAVALWMMRCGEKVPGFQDPKTGSKNLGRELFTVIGDQPSRGTLV